MISRSTSRKILELLFGKTQKGFPEEYQKGILKELWKEFLKKP